MDVFIIYKKDGYGSEYVDQVFGQMPAAIDFIINDIFTDNSLYETHTNAELREAAISLIEKHRVRNVS